MLTSGQRDAVFGAPYHRQDGALVSSPEWEAQNLTNVRFWGLDYRVHRKAKEPFLSLIDAWMRAGVFRCVRTLDRFYEFQTTPDGVHLRRHCHGNAFDVNSAWNPLGRAAHAGPGGTRPLIAIARARGWRCLADRGLVAKHFELVRL